MNLRNTKRPWINLHGMLFLIFFIIVAGILSLSVNAQPIMQANISLAHAMKIVDAVLAECSQPGDRVTVSVAVVDRAGQPVMQVRADTAAPHNWELVYRKAYTARTFRRNSIDWRDRTAGGADREGQRMLKDVIPLGGGAPIMIGNETIGAVGVSGSPDGQPGDTACAEVGAAAIADDLK